MLCSAQLKAAGGRPQSGATTATRDSVPRLNPRTVLRSKSDLQLDPSSLRMQFPLLRHSSSRAANSSLPLRQSGIASLSYKHLDKTDFGASGDHVSTEGIRTVDPTDASRDRTARGDTPDGSNVDGKRCRVVAQQLVTFDSVAAGLARGRFVSPPQHSGIPPRLNLCNVPLSLLSCICH
jgi:hypothetical protein